MTKERTETENIKKRLKTAVFLCINTMCERKTKKYTIIC